MKHSHCCFYNIFKKQVVIQSLKTKSNSETNMEQKRNQAIKCVSLGVWWNRMRRTLTLLINWETYFHLLILTHWSGCIHCDWYNAHKLKNLLRYKPLMQYSYVWKGKHKIGQCNVQITENHALSPPKY